MDIPKTYDPKQVEAKWYKYWEEHRLFRTDPASGRQPYCIMMPPPNITGELHMGHALQDSLQDMLIRLKRMQGFEALWQPGKDHAGIATQNVVEKSLAKEGVTRHQLGREKFVERVWQWKERFGDRIFEQKRLLGDSADWERERFTLDEVMSRAVAEVFVKLYEKGLIYRGDYIVNWCPRCHTAISDEEVDHQEHDGHLWYFRYPILATPISSRGQSLPPLRSRGGVRGGDFVTVATTRPETMLGDTAIAVNPDDERFKHLWDAKVILPLVGREIPVIRDEFVDPKFGTGQVKVTPAHDPDDFAMGQRHGLEFITVMDEDGVMNQNAPGQFRGMDRFAAREAVVEAMRDQGLLEKIEDYKTSIGHCQRCKTMIEPYLSRQWFVRMKPLADPAIQAVREGRIKFYPPRWEKVYYQWMENIRDWCISRQLWWGHRIPVWYCDSCGEMTVAVETPDKCAHCSSTALRQDEDVLDTWFSSWLFPFSTLGWPEKTAALKFWYPTDVLITGYDIIFFWVARMIMAGLEFAGDIPYRDIYITGMIRDEQGRWMSKSLGNGIDPAEMVEKYGSDAMRFTLITLASEGQDIKLAPSRFEGGRNFANKLWNSYRFLMSNAEKISGFSSDNFHFSIFNFHFLPDRWIASRLHRAVQSVLDNASKYRLNDCANVLYDFVWKEYCDWYLELVKVRLADDQPDEVRREALGVALGVFETALRMLHPAMPFITEEMWQGIQSVIARNSSALGRIPKQSPANESLEATKQSLMYQPFPQPDDYRLDEAAETEFDLIQRLVGAVRNIRSEMRIPPDRKAEVILHGASDAVRPVITSNLSDVQRLAGIADLRFDGERPAQAATAVLDEAEVLVPLEGLIDFAVERARLDKEIARMEGIIKSAEAKLNNPKFVDNAPAEVVEYERAKLADCQTQLGTLRRNRAVI